MKWFFIVFVCYTALNAASCARIGKLKNIVCYYLNGYGVSIAPPESLDPKLCTHLNYAFVRIDINGNLTVQRKDVDIDKRMYERVVSLKLKNPYLKVLISIGDTSVDIFSKVAADPIKRQNLVSSSLNFLKTHGFDGLDIDWEKPGAKDEENFVSLLKELKEALSEEKWLLTVAVYPYPYEGYDVQGIAKYVDMVHIMSYNFYGPWSAYTGHNAALFSSPLESAYEKRVLNTAGSLQNWLNAGLAKEKINVGIPFYGRTFTLVNASDNQFHSPIIGAGTPSTPSYKTICLNFTNYTQVWDDGQKISYKYFGNQWLSYDEERSVEEKAKYIKSQDIAGAMIWQIGLDDVHGECGPKQGLLQVVNQYLNGSPCKRRRHS